MKLKPVSLNICLLLLSTLSSFSALAQSPQDPSTRCLQNLQTDPALQILIPKVGSLNNADAASVDMMASEGTPTADEKKALSAWGNARQNCVNLGRSFRSIHAPTGFSVVYDAIQNAILRAIVGLQGGKMTYGQFVMERQRIAGLGRAKFVDMSRDADIRARAGQNSQGATEALQSGNAADLPGGGSMCMKQSEWQSGNYKNCVYRCLTGDVVESISFTQLCPLTITR